jgi:hypothetical protein
LRRKELGIKVIKRAIIKFKEQKDKRKWNGGIIYIWKIEDQEKEDERDW